VQKIDAFTRIAAGYHFDFDFTPGQVPLAKLMNQIPLFGKFIALQMDKVLRKINIVIEFILFAYLEIGFNVPGAVSYKEIFRYKPVVSKPELLR
jgi:hypothetical protein